MRLLSIAASLLLAINSGAVLAGDADQPNAEKASEVPDFATDSLTGDWGGARTDAANHGLVWEGGFKVDTLRNHGAIKNGTKSVSHLDLKLKMDLEKVAGWDGGSAMINVLSNSGRGLNYAANPYVGNLMGVTNIEIGTPTTTRLFQAWVEQRLFDDKLAVLAGLYPIDSEFFTADSAGVFLGPQYGAPADLALTRGPSIFNNSAFGVRARWNFDPTVYLMGAVLDGIPNDPNDPKRTAIKLGNGDGTMSIGEIGWRPQADNDQFKGHAKVAAGWWAYSSKEADLISGDARRQQGGYVLGESTLIRFDEERFLSGFARYTWGDGNSTALKNSLNLGVHVKGLLDSRPDDIFGVAWTRAGLSSKWREIQTFNTTGSEDSLELTYRFALTPWLAIQPHAQIVRHPGGDAVASNATLIGFRLELTL
jgi:porin